MKVSKYYQPRECKSLGKTGMEANRYNVKRKNRRGELTFIELLQFLEQFASGFSFYYFYIF